MKRLLVIIIGLFPTLLYAQDCNCTKNFDYVVTHVKAGYAGFSDKVKAKNRKAFEKFTKVLRERSAKAQSTDSCYVILKTWTDYFKDNHLRLQLDWKYREKYPEAAKRLRLLFAKPTATPSSAQKPGTKTSISAIDPATLLIRLPSFAWDQKKFIDSLLIAYTAQIKNTPNWIIDLRGNDGGTDYAFNGLMPYLYTDPVKIRPDEYRSSPTNIAVLQDNLKDEELSADAKGFLKNLIALMEQHPNAYVNPSGKSYFEIKLDSIAPYPKKVAILIDRNTASSAESFLLTAVQSKKVKVYGENSAGTLDYSSTQYFDIPCKDFNLVIPIARSTRLPAQPIDNIGIVPNVRIGPEETDPIGFIKKVMVK